GRSPAAPGALPGKQDGFGPFELLRLSVEHHHIAVAQHRLAARLAPQYSLPADAGEGHADTAAAHVAQRPAHCPGSRRHDHGLDLLTILVALVERPRIAAADDVSQYGVAVAANVTHRAHDSRYGNVQQDQHVRDEHETGFEGLRHDVGGAGVL